MLLRPFALLLFSALVCTPCRSAHGQAAPPPGLHPDKAFTQYVYRTWTMADGLPHNHVKAVLQTRDGYLWIGTYAGLVRFDGVAMTVLAPEQPKGLPGYVIETLYEDRQGNLWIGTVGQGALRYRRGIFTQYTTQHGLPDATVRTFYEDAAGVLYAGAGSGLARFEEEGFLPLTFPEGAYPGNLFALQGDKAGGWWLGHQRGLSHLTADRAWTTYTTADGLTDNHVYALHETSDGTLWIGTAGGANTLSGERLSTLGPTQHHDVRAIAAIREAGLWLGSYRGGLTRFFDAHAYETFSAEGGLMDGRIECIYQDREGSVWIGTGGGLIQAYDGPFTTYTSEEGLPHSDVRAILEDGSGTLWLATWGGLARRDEGGFTRYHVADGLRSNIVHALAEGTDGTLWIGTEEGVNWRREGHIGTLSQPGGPGRHRIQVIVEDRGGDLWIGTADDGLYRRREGAFTHYTVADGLPHSDVRVIHEDREGTLWVGTYGGLARFEAGRFAAVEALSGRYFRAIYEDDDGTLWFGTKRAGLHRYQSGEFTVFGTDDGLYDDDAWQILEDDAGYLWMCGDRGVYRVEKAALDAYSEGRLSVLASDVYGLEHGLKSVECNGNSRPAGWKARDGRLWFPTQKGAAVVDPRRLMPNPVPPNVVVEQVVTEGHALMPSPDGSPLHLTASQRDLEVAFTALSLRDPGSVRFQHMLVGYDPRWQGPHTRRSATYTNLDPGRYTFRVRAANNDGVWSESGATLMLTVAPYFYETGWFIGLCGLALLLLGWLGYRARTHQLYRQQQALETLVDQRTEELRAEKAKTEAQAERLRELDAAKSRFFANITHEFRTPLTLIIGPLKSALAGHYGPTEETLQHAHRMMLRNSQRLLRLINQILDLAKAESGRLTLDAQVHDLAGFTVQTARAFVPLAERQRIRLTFDAPRAPVAAVFDRAQLEKVLLNLISNALKFTEAGGAVEVMLRCTDAHAKIAVRDTGLGIAPETLPHLFDRFYQTDASVTRKHEGTGIGLALAKELIELHGGSITVESRVGAGSTFTVCLPLVPPEQAWPAGWGDGHADTAVREATEVNLGPLQDRKVLAGADIEDRTTVLVVDDNADVRAFVRSILEPAYRVLEASDGAAGLDKAKTALPDLIVSDVMMPRLDGFALSRALRDDPATDCIPVVLLTARADTEGELEGLETGADDYVTKPFEADVLRARVAGLIATRQRLRERFSRERPPHEPAPPVRSAFEQGLREIIEVHLTDPAFNPEALATDAALSYSQLYRRLRDEVGQTPSQFIRRVRVERAAHLLSEQAGTISEVAYAVGFNSLSYFNRSFRERFACAPSEYA